MNYLEEQSIYGYQSMLLSTMDLDRNKLMFSFTHPIPQSIFSGVYFRMVNIFVNTKDIPLPDRIYLHMQAGELIYNDLNKTSLLANNVEALLEKVLN